MEAIKMKNNRRDFLKMAAGSMAAVTLPT